jgi:hypothetical protein
VTIESCIERRCGVDIARLLLDSRLYDYIILDSERTLLADESAAKDAIDSNFAKRAAKFDLPYLKNASRQHVSNGSKSNVKERYS